MLNRNPNNKGIITPRLAIIINFLVPDTNFFKLVSIPAKNIIKIIPKFAKNSKMLFV